MLRRVTTVVTKLYFIWTSEHRCAIIPSKHSSGLSGFNFYLTALFCASSGLLYFVSDYRLNLIAPNEITDFGKFRTSLGLVLEAIKYSSDEAAMGQLFSSNPLFKALDIETASAINTFTHLNLHFNEKEATTNMCKAWDDHRLSGKIEGSTLKLIDQTIKKVKKGYSVEQIADMLEESIETIQPIYDIIISIKSEYDAEKIYELLNRTPVSA